MIFSSLTSPLNRGPYSKTNAPPPPPTKEHILKKNQQALWTKVQPQKKSSNKFKFIGIPLDRGAN